MIKKIGRGERHNTFTDFTRRNKLVYNGVIDRSKGISAYINVHMICCKYTCENEHKIYLWKHACYIYCNLKKPVPLISFCFPILNFKILFIHWKFKWDLRNESNTKYCVVEKISGSITVIASCNCWVEIHLLLCLRLKNDTRQNRVKCSIYENHSNNKI